jgi:exonuclease VII large subunit
MKNEEIIRRYGKEAYEKQLEQMREYYKAHREELKAVNKRYHEENREDRIAASKEYIGEHLEQEKARAKKYLEQHPERVKAIRHEQHRKGGKYYDRNLKNEHSGLRGDKNRIRMKHAHQYKPYKDIIAPDSQLHHEWIPNTDEYRGVALVEAEQHMHGIVDVIEILNGKITLLTEEEVKKGKKKK